MHELCNTPKDLREYVAEHGLRELWSGGVLEALDAVEGLPPAPLYTPDEIQTMQDMEWSQMEKMYELGKEERKKGKWIEGRDKRFVKCSKCGMEITKNELAGISLFGKNEPNYCPNCGADMRGEQDEIDKC